MLSKSTTDQIRKEAEEANRLNFFCAPAIREQHFLAKEFKKDGYIMGATAWAVWKEKAEVLAEKAQQVFDFYNGSDEDWRISQLGKALEQFKEG